jgi:hypothetical protein
MIRSRLIVTKATPLAPRGLVTAEHPLGAEVGAKILTCVRRRRLDTDIGGHRMEEPMAVVEEKITDGGR